MSEDAIFEPSKRRLVIYFTPANGEDAKNFAARARNGQNVETTLVWAQKFQDDSSMVKAHGVVIDYSAPNRDMIAKMYTAMMPDCEVHYMSEGTLYDPSQDQPIFNTPNTGADEADTQPVSEEAGTDTGSTDESEAVQAEQSDDGQAEPSRTVDADAQANADDAGSDEGGTDDEDRDAAGAAV